MSVETTVGLTVVAVYAPGIYVTIVFMGLVSAKFEHRLDLGDLFLAMIWPVLFLSVFAVAVKVGWLAVSTWLWRAVPLVARVLQIATLPLHPWRIGRLLAGRGWE